MNLPRVYYTDHAKERMQERNIQELEVEKVLSNPEIKYPGKNPGTYVAERTLSPGQTLKIVFAPAAADFRVISVMWKGR